MREMTLRRGLAVGASALAGTLALSSVAFACGTWRGRFTVTGLNGTISAGVGINGTGASGMDYCPGTAQPNNAQIEGVSTTNAASPNLGLFTVTAAPASDCLLGGINKLPAGTYTINYVPRTGLCQPGGFNHCMNVSGTGGGSAVTSGVGVPIGTITVNSSGNAGPKAFQALSPPDAGGSLVCISSPSGDDGNQLAVRFI